MTAILITLAVVILILGAVPLLLCLLPDTRNCSDNWIVTLKIVPAALIVFLILLRLLWLLPGPWDYVIAIAAGVFTMYRLGKFLQKKAQAENRFSFLPMIVILPGYIALTVFLIFVSWLVIFFTDLADGVLQSDRQISPLLRTENTQIDLETIPTHPFLAEYEYRIRVSQNGTERIWHLIPNTGGHTDFGLFQLKDGRHLLRNKDADYILDSRNGSILLLGSFNGNFYTVPLPGGKIDSGSAFFEQENKVVIELNSVLYTATPAGDVLNDMVRINTISPFPGKTEPH